MDPGTGSVSGHFERLISHFLAFNLLSTDSPLSRYSQPEDNRETHRAGKAYQAFRAAVVNENLLNGYPDVRFWRPTGVGFLTQVSVNLEKSHEGSFGYIVIQYLVPREGTKAKILDNLQSLAILAEKSESVGSFWVLGRDNHEDGQDLTLFAAFERSEDYGSFRSAEPNRWMSVEDLCEKAVTTTWTNSSIGFLGR